MRAWRRYDFVNGVIVLFAFDSDHLTWLGAQHTVHSDSGPQNSAICKAREAWCIGCKFKYGKSYYACHHTTARALKMNNVRELHILWRTIGSLKECFASNKCTPLICWYENKGATLAATATTQMFRVKQAAKLPKQCKIICYPQMWLFFGSRPTIVLPASRLVRAMLCGSEALAFFFIAWGWDDQPASGSVQRLALVGRAKWSNNNKTKPIPTDVFERYSYKASSCVCISIKAPVSNPCRKVGFLTCLTTPTDNYANGNPQCMQAPPGLVVLVTGALFVVSIPWLLVGTPVHKWKERCL